MKNLILILFLSVATISSAQWIQMSNGISSNTGIYSMAYNGTDIYASTIDLPSTCGIFKSTNYGANWTKLTTYAMIVSALAVNGNYIWAGVFNSPDSGVYVSSDNGVSWTHSSLNNRSIYSLAASGSNVFAGTFNHGIYYSSDNGYNWVHQAGLGNKDVDCVAINGSVVYAGTEGTGVYYSTNNGTDWIQTSLNNQNIMSLAFSGNNIYAGTIQHGIYISTDNGTSWTQSSLNDKTVYSITANGNNIFAGINYNGTGGVYVSTNNGTNWLLKSQGFNPQTLGVISIFILNNYVFAGTTYSVWRRSLSEILGIQNISTEIPSSYSLSQNYPNPFNPATRIKFSIPDNKNRINGNGIVTLKVYDILGKEIETLVNENLQPGTYETTFDGSALNSGVYFYILSIDDKQLAARKMLLIK